MGNRELRQIAGAIDSDTVFLTGFLSIAADASVTQTSCYCKCGVFAKPTGTGLYTLTLRDRWSQILTIQLTPIKATAADNGRWDVVTAPGINGTAVGNVITLRHCVGSTGAAADPGAIMGVFVKVEVKNTKVRP